MFTINRQTFAHSETFVPEHMREGLERYLSDGIPAGGFMQAVLSKDLSNAFIRADAVNAQHVGHILAWLFNYAPRGAWGSLERYDAWVSQGGAGGGIAIVEGR